MWPACLSSAKLSLNLRRLQPAYLQINRNILQLPKPKTRLYRGIFITDGMQCHKGDVLVRTWKFQYYPGLNVGFTQELDYKVLRALCDGKVFITTEKVDPDFAFADVEGAYGWRKEVIEGGATKLTFNVVPEEQEGRFRLKECI